VRQSTPSVLSQNAKHLLDESVGEVLSFTGWAMRDLNPATVTF
jgi:hypothetical protein